jgi:hypothetical protein
VRPAAPDPAGVEQGGRLGYDRGPEPERDIGMAGRAPPGAILGSSIECNKFALRRRY